MNRNGESLHDEKATGNLRTRGAQPLKHSSSRVPDLQFQPSSTKSKRRRRLEIGTEKLKTEHGIKPLTVLGWWPPSLSPMARVRPGASGREWRRRTARGADEEREGRPNSTSVL